MKNSYLNIFNNQSMTSKAKKSKKEYIDSNNESLVHFKELAKKAKIKSIHSKNQTLNEGSFMQSIRYDFHDSEKKPFDLSSLINNSEAKEKYHIKENRIEN